MFVQNFNELGPSIRSKLGSNPFSSDLNGARDAVSYHQNEFNNHVYNIQEWERQIENAKIQRQVQKQQLANARVKLNHIQTAFNEASKSVDCEYLNVESMVQFFEGINHKFIRLWIDERNAIVLLEFIRPAGFVSYLPVPPLHITMEYKINSGKVSFKTAKARASIKCNDYFHPHISEPSICMGNFTDVIDSNNFSIHLDGYQDHVLLLNNLLQTYNPDSPYRTPAEILANCMRMIYMDTLRSEIVSTIVLTSGYQFSHPKLNHNQSTYNVYDIIGLKEHEAYIENLKGVKLWDIADDFQAKLMTLEHSGDNDEEYDYMSGVRNSITANFPDLSFAEVADYGSVEENDDGDENSYLDEDGFYDLKNSWLETIKESMETMDKDKTIVLTSVPDLNSFFVDRETSNDEERQYVFN